MATPDLLARKFDVPEPDRGWAADLTYCWTREGWLFFAAVLDLGSRRMVGGPASSRADQAVACKPGTGP